MNYEVAVIFVKEVSYVISSIQIKYDIQRSTNTFNQLSMTITIANSSMDSDIPVWITIIWIYQFTDT